MALVLCPECQHQVSDKALQCPSCGYDLMSYFINHPTATRSKASVAAVSSGAESVLPEAEKRFREEALKIVTTCSKALESPRMVFSSMLAEADGMLGMLRSNHRRFLEMEKYTNVEGYSMNLITSCKSVQLMDQAMPESGATGIETFINTANRMVHMTNALSRPKAYIHDLRIILGAGYGTPDEVTKMFAKDAEENNAKPAGAGCLAMMSTLSAIGACLVLILLLLLHCFQLL